MKYNIHTILTIVYATLLVVGAILFIFDVHNSQYLFAIGAVLAIIQSILYALQNKSDDRRIQRLHRLNFIASLFLGVAAWLMFQHNTSWVPFVIIYALVVFYLSFRTK